MTCTGSMLAIIRILHGCVQIAAGRSYYMDDVIDLQRAVVAVREHSSDADIRDMIDDILGMAALDRGEGVDFDEIIKKVREIATRKRG